MDERQFENQLSRRRFLAAGAGAVGGAALAGSVGARGAWSASDAKGTLTLADWGGTSDEGFKRAFGIPFTKATGWKVNTVSPIDYGKFAAQIKSGKVQWDWIDAEGWFPYAHPELLQPLDHKVIGVKKSDLLYPEFWQGSKAIADYSTSFVIAYRKDHKGPVPRTWPQFFDTKNIPGKRSLYNWPYGMLEIALMGDGVPFNKLYPLDVDRGIAKIKSIKNDLVFWNSGADSQQFLISGAADFVVPWNNRVAYLALGGLPVAIEWAGAIHSNGMHIIPKGDPRAAMCNQFIKVAMRPENQAKLALYAGFGPTTKKGYAMADSRMKPWLNVHPPNWKKSFGVINDRWWGPRMDDIQKKWYAELS